VKIYKNLRNQIWSFPDLRDFLKKPKTYLCHARCQLAWLKCSAVSDFCVVWTAYVDCRLRNTAERLATVSLALSHVLVNLSHGQVVTP